MSDDVQTDEQQDGGLADDAAATRSGCMRLYPNPTWKVVVLVFYFLTESRTTSTTL